MSSSLPILVARHAMGTRFELVLHGARPEALRAAGEEALDEVERLENLLSLYRPHTDIARINAAAGRDPVRVAPETFRLLERARALCDATEGAFDVTAGPLVRVWGFHGGGGRMPSPAELEAALRVSGWNRVSLDPAEQTVRIGEPGGLLDLGALGKGYALDRAAGILREAGVESALIHGGTSTVVALGNPPGAEAWSVGIASNGSLGGESGETVSLKDGALSVSAVWGRSFTDPDGRILGHVLDPRTGIPVSGMRSAAVALASAAESDALSTALLVLGESGRGRMEAGFPGVRLWLAAH